MRHALLTATTLAAAAATLTHAQPAHSFEDAGIQPVPICQLVPNGSFIQGFLHWSRDLETGGFGAHDEGGSLDIVDLSATPGCDAHVACLNNFSFATWTSDHPSGSAGSAQLVLSTKATVTGRYLRFKTTGGFEFIIWAGGQVNYDITVRVTSESGEVVECAVLDGAFGCGDFQLECGQGIAALGIVPHETHCCDITGASEIAIGDSVQIDFIFSSSAVALNECDEASFFGSACIDRVQFCNACLVPFPGEPGPIDFQPVSDHPARDAAAATSPQRRDHLLTYALSVDPTLDLNADGAVDMKDAAALSDAIAAGALDAPQYDINRDGTVNGADVAALVERIDLAGAR